MKRGKILNFVLLSVIILFFLSFVSAFSLTGKVISVSPTGWAISFADKGVTSVDKEVTSVETIEEVKKALEKDNSVDVIIDEVEVTIKKVDGNVEFDDGTKVQTEEKLTIEEGKISVVIKNKDVEIKILPSKITDDLKENSSIEDVENIELKVLDNISYYEVKGKRNIKILGLISVSRGVTIEVDAQSGETLNEFQEKGFLANLFNNLFSAGEIETVEENFSLIESRGYLTEEEQTYAAFVLAEVAEVAEVAEEPNLSIKEFETSDSSTVDFVLDDVVIFTLNDFNKESNAITANAIADDCIIFTQAMIDSTGESNPEIYFDGGCVGLDSDLNMGNKTLIVRGGVTFDCDGHNLLGSGYAGIYSYENTFVKNCVITGRTDYGFRSYNSSTVENSLAENNGYVGFQVEHNSNVLNSTARDNERGFRVAGGSTVEYSTASDNHLDGFYLYSSGTVVNSVAENNWFGLRSQGSSHIIDSVAINNDHGFSVQQSSDVEGSTAIDSLYEGFSLTGAASVIDSTSINSNYGFKVRDTSSVESSTAEDNNFGFRLYDASLVVDSTAVNNNHGFWLEISSYVEGSTAIDSLYNGFKLYDFSSVIDSTSINSDFGFRLYGSSSVEDSAAEDNNYGFSVQESSYIDGSIAVGNNYGFILLNNTVGSRLTALNNLENGIFIDTNANIINGIRSCSNGGNDIFVNMATINTNYYLDNAGGAWYGALETLPCSAYHSPVEDVDFAQDETN